MTAWFLQWLHTWLLSERCQWVMAQQGKLWAAWGDDGFKTKVAPAYCQAGSGMGLTYFFTYAILVGGGFVTWALYDIGKDPEDTYRARDFGAVVIVGLLATLVLSILPMLWNHRLAIFILGAVGSWFYGSFKLGLRRRKQLEERAKYNSKRQKRGMVVA